jgi:hypothetical protein
MILESKFAAGNGRYEARSLAQSIKENHTRPLISQEASLRTRTQEVHGCKTIMNLSPTVQYQQQQSCMLNLRRRMLHAVSSLSQ